MLMMLMMLMLDNANDANVKTNLLKVNTVFFIVILLKQMKFTGFWFSCIFILLRIDIWEFWRVREQGCHVHS